MPSSAEIADRLKQQAQALGFVGSGICAAVQPPGLEHLWDWLAAGYAGEMHWFEQRRGAYTHPEHVLAGAKSLLVLAYPYRTEEPQPAQPGQGRVSRYAWGFDYHDVVRKKLRELVKQLQELRPEASARGVVDTAPLLEGEFAQLAGLGWIGKNTLLLNREFGSWFFLAAVLTDVELPPDEPFTANHCGTCRACLDACPTDAFVDAYQLDATKCISYLTIELRENVPEPLRNGLGDWVFGCDICQDVCPWNRKVPAQAESPFTPRDGLNPLNLLELFDLSEEEFRPFFRRTPLWRAKRRGLLRNAALVLGNQGDPQAIPALAKGLQDEEALVRSAAAWALGQMEEETARQVLLARWEVEWEESVRSEISRALENYPR